LRGVDRIDAKAARLGSGAREDFGI